MLYSLVARRNGEVIFHSEGKWLYPLLDLEDRINEEGWDGSELELEDKIAGKAAAFLMVRMGVRRVYAHMLSELAEEVFRSYGVEYRFDIRVPRIACQTEEILATLDDPEEAALIILRRAGREMQVPLIVESLYVSRNGKPVLKNLTFAVGKGERVVIRGPNGTGKSTFLRSILGLVPSERGTVLIHGEEQRIPDPAHVGYLSQESAKDDLNITVEEVVEVGTLRFRCSSEERKSRVSHALSLTGMDGFQKRTFRSLSGGELRRCDLARCFAQEPEILLLDEPTANLDPDAKKEVLEVLHAYGEKKKATVVMVTHEESHFHLPGWKSYLLEQGRLYPQGHG